MGIKKLDFESICFDLYELDTPNYLISELDQFKEQIQSSPDECWRRTARNRKNAICNKLTELQELICGKNTTRRVT